MNSHIEKCFTTVKTNLDEKDEKKFYSDKIFDKAISDAITNLLTFVFNVSQRDTLANEIVRASLSDVDEKSPFNRFIYIFILGHTMKQLDSYEKAVEVAFGNYRNGLYYGNVCLSAQSLWLLARALNSPIALSKEVAHEAVESVLFGLDSDDKYIMSFAIDVLMNLNKRRIPYDSREMSRRMGLRLPNQPMLSDDELDALNSKVMRY